MGLVRLKAGDEARLEAFLGAYADSSMIPRSNLARAGLAWSGQWGEAEYLAVEEDGELRGVVGHAWNGNLLLQAPLHAAQLSLALATSTGRAVAGLLGPWDQVEAARALLHPGPARLARREVLMGLSLDLLRLSPEPGLVRPPRPEELDQVAAWRVAFDLEALKTAPTPGALKGARQMAEDFAARGDLFVLELGGRLHAMGLFNARLPDAVQLGGIYTPPEARNAGAARRLVAGALLQERARGVSQALLFTDNPAARRAYAAVGFEERGHYGLVLI